MDEQYLTVKDVALLKNCTERYVRVLIERGELRGVEVSGLAAGQGGVQYRIPLSSLDERLQLKFKRRLKQRENELKAVGAEDASAEAAPISDDELTGDEREEIAFWKETLGEWRTYRNTCRLSKHGEL